ASPNYAGTSPVFRSRTETVQERPSTPDSAEVVRRQHALDRVGLDRHERAASWDSCVVDEQLDSRMTSEAARRDVVDRRSIHDVTDLPLTTDLRSECLDPLLAAREQDAVPAAPG